MQAEILLLDALSPDAMQWLAQRYRVTRRSMVQLDRGDEETLKDFCAARAMVLPSSAKVTTSFLQLAGGLEVIGRLAGGTGNTDFLACQDHGVAVLNSDRAGLHSSVEFMLTGLLSLHRPGIWGGLKSISIASEDAQEPHVAKGKELFRSVVGILGLGQVTMALAPVLQAMGVRLVGYDPAIHSTAEIWQKLNIYPLPLAGVLSTADAMCMNMIYASRFRHFVNEHVLKHCKRGQIWVSGSRSALFDSDAMQAALTDGRISACLIDSAEVGMAGLKPELLNLPNFFLTPRVGAHTAQAYEKASWYLAHRIDGVLQGGSGFLDHLDSTAVHLRDAEEGASDEAIQQRVEGIGTSRSQVG
jgi:phosphoglycerate dehydrogenase-like enzyme